MIPLLTKLSLNQATLARELSRLGYAVTPTGVRMWKLRGRLPFVAVPYVMQLAEIRRVPVTWRDLVPPEQRRDMERDGNVFTGNDGVRTRASGDAVGAAG